MLNKHLEQQLFYYFKRHRSRLTGACGERIAQEARLSAGLSLYGRLRPARPPECVPPPLVIYSGVDKPVHIAGQAASPLPATCPSRCTHPYPHTSRTSFQYIVEMIGFRCLFKRNLIIALILDLFSILCKLVIII